MQSSINISENWCHTNKKSFLIISLILLFKSFLENVEGYKNCIGKSILNIYLLGFCYQQSRNSQVKYLSVIVVVEYLKQ
jgi:hypothetical protein